MRKCSSAQEHSLTNTLVNRLCTNKQQTINQNIFLPFDISNFLLCTFLSVEMAVLANDPGALFLGDMLHAFLGYGCDTLFDSAALAD